MNRLEDLLSEQEQLIYRTRIHRYQMLFSLLIVLYSVVNIWFLVLAIPYMAYAVVNYFYHEYLITNYRVIIKKGLFYIRTEEILINEIDDVIIRRSLSDKIIRGGTIYIFGSAIETKKLQSLGNPTMFRNALYSQLPTSKIGYFEKA